MPSPPTAICLPLRPTASYDPRQTEVVFRGKTDATLADTVKVYQAYKGAIVVAKNEYEVDAVGGALDFKVQTNLDLEVTVSADWIKAGARAYPRTGGKGLVF